MLRGSWRQWDPPEEKSAATIGVLDGVHRGHRALIASLDEGLLKTVLTFEPHPVEVLRPGTRPRLITTIDERLSLLADAGVEQVGVLDLAEIKNLKPADFVEEVLVRTLRVGMLVVGPDFRYGRDRTGDITLLQHLGAAHDFDVEIIELVDDGEGPVSSSRIRLLIESGRLEEAEEALTTRFRMTGTVVKGAGRGRDLSFPTANLELPNRKVMPGDGVYAAFALVGDRVRHGAVNIGVRPTFGEGERVVEAFLADFADDIYGEEVTLEFVAYLRAELRFESVAELVDQMKSDVETASRLLDETTSSMG